jgi:hypothetical protein
MTTTTATINVRTGLQADLTGLDSGELGMADDTNRLFIGTPAQTIIADGTTATFPVDLAKIKYGNKLYITVNAATTAAAVAWTPGAGIVTIAPQPMVGDIIEIRANNEVQLKNSAVADMQSIPLLASVPVTPTGLTFNATTVNTGLIEFSVAGAGYKQVGTFYFISDAGQIEYAANALSIGQNKVELTASIINGVISIDYTNTDTAPSTLYYNTKAWKTV